jgi:hypothetical protein
MPPFIARCVDSIRGVNPDWEHRFYTDEDWKEIVDNNGLIDWQTFNRFPTGIQRADVFRCVTLYEYGGVYADVDMFAFRPLDSMLAACIEAGVASDDTEVIVTTDHPVHSRQLFGGGEVIMNNFIAAKPGARFLRMFIEHFARLAGAEDFQRSDPLWTTGPLAMSKLIEEAGGPEVLKIAVVPYFWVNPLPDMSLSFDERAGFDEIISDGSWVARFCPYLAHYWWHSNWARENMLDRYGEKLLRRR